MPEHGSGIAFELFEGDCPRVLWRVVIQQTGQRTFKVRWADDNNKEELIRASKMMHGEEVVAAYRYVFEAHREPQQDAG